MLAQTQTVLSNSASKVMGSVSATKALAGAHPVGFGIAVGLGAYFIIDKYWLSKGNSDGNSDNDDAVTTEAESTETTT